MKCQKSTRLGAVRLEWLLGISIAVLLFQLVPISSHAEGLGKQIARIASWKVAFLFTSGVIAALLLRNRTAKYLELLHSKKVEFAKADFVLFAAAFVFFSVLLSNQIRILSLWIAYMGDVRRWPSSVWIALNFFVVFVLVCFRILPNLIEDWRVRRKNSIAERADREKIQKAREQKKLLQEQMEAKSRRIY